MVSLTSDLCVGIPDPPSYVSLTVASSSSLLVKFDEPLNHNGAVVTRYKGRKNSNFQVLAGRRDQRCTSEILLQFCCAY